MGTQKNPLNEMVLLSIQNTCFKGMAKKKSHFYAQKVNLTRKSGNKLFTTICHFMKENGGSYVISNDNVTVLKACGKRALADVDCYCKMTSVVALPLQN